MTEKYITYKLNGETFDVPESQSAAVERDYPDITIEMRRGDEVFDIPLAYKQDVINQYGSELTYLYDKEEQEPNFESNIEEPFDRPNVGETFIKGIGAAGVGTAKLALDLGRAAWNTSVIGGAANKIKEWMNPEHGSMDERLRDEDNPITRASMKLGDLQERLSREADPTGGQQGFVDLISEGKVGMAMQKALGSGLESLPMMLAAGTGPGAIIYGAGMAASQYADETRENPDIPAWKRGVNALGSAALEMAVEKIGGPLKNVFGKAGGELTEEAAQAVIEKFAKDGTETIAKRITGGLLKLGKEGLEEGGEEVLTSFGNDALGEALDLIDGDKDYGIRAQWEQIKEENPDANIKDFAKSKAKEYLDSFLGGALSGMEISGTTQAIQYAANNKDLARNQLDRRYELGSKLNYGDMYDTDGVVTESIDAASKVFVDRDGNTTLSREFLEFMSAEDAFALANKEDLPRNQREILYDLAGAKAVQEGLNKKLDAGIDDAVAKLKAKVEPAIENGKVVIGTHDGKDVFIKGTTVAKNGRIVLPKGPVVVIDQATGEQYIANDNVRVFYNYDADKYLQKIEDDYRSMEADLRQQARTTMSPRAKTKAILPFAKKKILVDVGNGLTEVYVRQINSDGSVMIEGKKGDLGGQSILTLDATTFYDSIYRDNDGNPVVTEVEPQTEGTIENEPTEEPVAPTELTGEEDFRGYEGKIFIGGRLVDVIDAQQDNPSNTVNYTYLDENGNERVGTTTIGEFAAAIQQAQAQNVEPAPVVSPEPQPAPKDDVVAVPIPTESIDWDALLDNDAEAYFNELQNRFGDKAERRLNAMITATENRLNKLNKENPQTTEEVFANDELKEVLENRLEVLRGLAARFTTTAEPAPVEPATAEPTAVEPAPAAPVEAPVTEAPTEGKSENGFEFNEHNVCTNPEVISVPPVKKGWAVMNEVRLAEFNGKWGSAIDAHTGTGGVGIPLTKSDCKFDTKEEAIADAYNALVRFRASRDKDTGLKDLDNLIKHLEKEYPFVKDAAAPTTPAPAPFEPAPAYPIVTENGFIVINKEITNPEVIEMPNTPKGDANRIFIGEYNGKWTYGAEALMDNGSWGMTPKMRIENARYDTREDAIKAGISFLESQWKDRHKDAGSTALDSFIEYVRNNYLANTSDSQGNSVPLGNEPTGENNGSKGEAASNETEGQGAHNMGGRADNEGANAGEEAITEEQSAHENSNNAEGGLDDKYPPRNGDVTPKDLENTFGFKHVATILPQSILNSSYDVFMGMAKMLGISPKSITHGGELRLAKMDDSAPKGYDAAYSQDGRNNTRVQYKAIKLRGGRNLAGIAHEWFHSLDHVLRHWNSGKGVLTTTNAGASTFDGRPEVLSAFKDLLKAIKDSGHLDRIDTLNYDDSYRAYLKSRVEQTARAFEEYVVGKFAEAGIAIEGVYKDSWVAQPTEEEMKIIAPAFDNLFKVLQEKEGRNPESSILYHIGEQMAPGSDAWKQATDTVLNALSKAGIEVVRVTEQQVAEVINNANENGAEILKTTDGVVYGWTDGQKVYLTEAGINPNTPIHEYTHLWADAMMRKNPKGWNSIKDLLKSTPLWNAVVNDPNYGDIANNEDAIASEVLSRISGAENAHKLEQMAQEMIENAKGTMRKAEARGIIQNIKDALNKFWNWVSKELFGIEKFNSINEVTDRVLWDLMNQTDLDIPNAGEATQITNANGDVIADTNGKGKVRFSISTWRDGGRDYLVNWLKNDKTLTDDEKADIVARMDEFYENAQKYTDVYAPFGSWSEAAVKYDENGNPLMSVIKANGDYAMNLDFSLVCKKRRPLNMLLRELINRNAFGTYSLRERELAEINWILQEYGFEVACALCFVDSKRYRVTGVADVFAQLYNKFVKALAPQGAQIAHFNYSNNPNVESVEGGIDTMSDEQLNWKKFDALAKKYKPTSVEGKVAKFLRENPSQRRLVDATDFIDANGFEAVKANNEALLSLYNSKKGSGGPKASFGDVQYLNDILKKEGAFDVDKAYAVGGVRLQSFSDFVPHMYFDYMQLFAELAAKKLPAHAYTKEVLFAKIFGLTGLKINMSLVPSVVDGGVAPGLDADGNYAWADAIKDKDGNIIQQAQSFPFDEAMAIQNAEGYSKNCGVIAVGISDEHIEKMLDDPNIPYIIPYHKSSLNAIVARMTNIDQYKDYTKVQNTKLSDGTNLPKGTPDFNFNEYLYTHKDATPQDAAQAYLDWCKEKGYLPKFRQFAYHPNYYKLLQDFNTMDTTTGEYAPQGAVSMTFPTEQNAFGNVETLIQQGLQEDADLEDKMNTDIKKAADAVEKRLAEIKKEPKLSEKKQKEQMAQLADERMARIKERADADSISSRRSTPVEFYQVEVDKFLSKYNPNCEVNVYPINEETAKAFGYTLEELKKKLARYMPDYDFIAIFAREDITESGDIEEALFHESIHKLSNTTGYTYLTQAGKWMWEHSSDNELFDFYRKYIEKNYSKQSEERKHDEMLAYVLSDAMKHGMVDVLKKITPKEAGSFFNEILNEIGYDSGAEASKRRDEQSVSQSDMAEEYDWEIGENGRRGEGFGQTEIDGRSKDSSEEVSRSYIQNAAVDYNVGETRDGIIERAVSEEAQKLGVNVTFAKRSEMAKGHETDKGYYNTKTGEIVICQENNASIADAIQTILHEAVAHKGLRQLMGERFNEFISRVYDSLDAKTKAEVDKLAEDHYNGNTAVAMEEYMASLAEREDFNDNTIWDKIKNFFTDLINRILDRDDIVIGDNELRYILRASYNNMVNPRGMETVRGWAKDQTMREEYKINEATPELLSRTGIDPTEVSRETARSTYDRVVADSWQEFQRQFQDAMQPVRIAIDAIQQETGNIPIEDYENYILIQNHASSRSRVEIDEFVYKHYKPLIAKVNEVVSKIIEARGGNIKSEKERAYAYQELKVYLIAKHGLERNKYYQSTNTRKLNPYEKQKETEKVTKEFEDKVNNINLDDTLNDTEKELAIRNAEVELAASITEINERMVPDLRDYSGLTSLFGYSPRKWEKAEEEAQLKVEEMEALIGEDVVNALWGKINAATNKTLRHSYESGLLSRQQYEDISKMFKFYIPLRGFDETTAEDVYSYARFEGNRFNPAVQTAKGRTSVADDPIAIIMNMAESEIAQGNKNRAKQALYYFLLNRSAGQSDQNSLMQIESVWYTIEVDESGKETYTIAAPDHESGETYEEFENRMIALEAENKAAKSKKGKVNIGKRFQKQMDRNAHYVYLKVNGVEKAIYINGNPKAADAINGTYMPKPNEFTNKWRDINRLISSTFTNYSLGFTARNFVRDALYSRINIAIKESNPEYRKKFRQNWWHAFGSMRKLINAFRNGELDRPDLTEDEAMFVEFMRNGGQTGYTVINSVEAHKKDLEKAIKRMQKGIEHGGVKDTTAFKVLVGWIEVMNEASELLTRYTAYKTSRDLGRGIEKSVGDAKEISVNFNTRGAQDGTGGFGWFARYFGLTKYFFNASVQGVQNIGAMAQANKLKFCKVAGGIMAAGVVTPLVTGFIASIFGGDDDEEYWNIPEYDRQNNICIQMGGSYVKIPLPIGFRELYAIGDMVAAIAFDKKFDRDFVQVGTDMANKIASIVLPINPLESTANGLSLWDTMLYTALPSTLQFWVQNATNTDWKGAPLQKEYTYNEDDPQWMKAFNSNPKWMRCLSKWCNENINPDGDFDGWDWSPEKLDNTLSNLFGGVYTMVKQGGRTISTIISEDKDFRAASIPLVGVLLDTGINDDDRFVTDAYFDMKEYYDANVNSIKRTAKAFGYSLEEVFGDEPVGIHHPKMQKIYKNRNFDWMQEWYKGDKEIKSLSDKIKRREKKLAGMEEPSVELVEEITNLKNEHTTKRRDFVNDMLELD